MNVFHNCWNKAASSQIFDVDFIFSIFSDYSKEILTISVCLTKYSEIVSWKMKQEIFCVKT